MTDRWTRYEATLFDKCEQWTLTVFVFGMTEATAREKLTAEYPHKRYSITAFKINETTDPLSDPDSYKGAKGPFDK